MKTLNTIWRKLFGIGRDGTFTKADQRIMAEYRRNNRKG